MKRRGKCRRGEEPRSDLSHAGCTYQKMFGLCAPACIIIYEEYTCSADSKHKLMQGPETDHVKEPKRLVESARYEWLSILQTPSDALQVISRCIGNASKYLPGA